MVFTHDICKDIHIAIHSPHKVYELEDSMEFQTFDLYPGDVLEV